MLKHQHTKRPPKHQGVKRCSHQSLALGAAFNQTSWSREVKECKIWGHGQSLPDNQTPWSQGVKECKIWGHGQQHSQLFHLQLPPQVSSALGNQLWHQNLKTQTSTGHTHPQSFSIEASWRQLWLSRWQQQVQHHLQQRHQHHLCVQRQRQGHLHLHNVEADLHLRNAEVEVHLRIVEAEVSLALVLRTEVTLAPLLHLGCLAEVMLDLLLLLTPPQLALCWSVFPGFAP